MMRAGSGHLELIGPTWFLKVWQRKADLETGEVKRVRIRILVGPRTELRSEKAARAKADRWLASQNPESLEPGVHVTVAEYLAHFIALHVALMRESSQRRYVSVINHHLAPEFAGELLDAVDLRRIQGYAVKLAPKFARETVRSIVAILLQVLTQARRDGFAVHRIDRASVKLPKAQAVARERPHFDDKALAALIASSPWPWCVLWAVMGYSGLRISEALGLTWANVYLDNRVIRVRQQAVLGRLLLPKTATSQADVPILPELGKILTAYRESWPSNPVGLLWISRRGTPLRADNVRTRVLHPQLLTLGIPKAGLHAFRHGLPARLNALGVSPGVVQKCMRHASLAQTEAYLHVDSADVHAALDAARVRSRGSAASDSAGQNGAGTSV